MHTINTGVPTASLGRDRYTGIQVYKYIAMDNGWGGGGVRLHGTVSNNIRLSIVFFSFLLEAHKGECLLLLALDIIVSSDTFAVMGH